MKESESSPNWAALVFDPDFMPAITKLAEKRFGKSSLSEEGVTYVIDYLSANDWEKCKSFQGKSQTKTFLFSLSSNALEEFSRKRFGRPRPPAWLQEMGELWVKLWRSLCLERQVLPAITDRYVDKGFREAEAVTHAARVIKARIPTCGQSSRDTELADDIDRLSDAHQNETETCDTQTPDFENPFHAELLMMVRATCNEDVESDDFSSQASVDYDAKYVRNQSGLEKLKSALSLSAEEKIMLRMVYAEGLSKSAASKALGLPSHQAGRIINDTLARISGALHDSGLELDELLELA